MKNLEELGGNHQMNCSGGGWRNRECEIRVESKRLETSGAKMEYMKVMY